VSGGLDDAPVRELPGGVPWSPIVADGKLIVATGSGDVLAYDGPDA
jgi:hypothetical protein